MNFFRSKLGGLADVDPHDPALTKREGIALALMIDKREQYVKQGRSAEAHGAGTMIRIMFDATKEKQVADTGWSAL